MKKTDIAIMKEMREACAAFIRVIASHGLIDEFEKEFGHMGATYGLGVKFHQLIDRLEKEDEMETNLKIEWTGPDGMHHAEEWERGNDGVLHSIFFYLIHLIHSLSKMNEPTR